MLVGQQRWTNMSQCTIDASNLCVNVSWKHNFGTTLGHCNMTHLTLVSMLVANTTLGHCTLDIYNLSGNVSCEYNVGPTSGKYCKITNNVK